PSPSSTLFPYTTLFRSEPFTGQLVSVPAPRAEHNGAGPLTSARNSMFDRAGAGETDETDETDEADDDRSPDPWEEEAREVAAREDRKSTRLNSSHVKIS